jgi:hypothetical protein
MDEGVGSRAERGLWNESCSDEESRSEMDGSGCGCVVGTSVTGHIGAGVGGVSGTGAGFL